MFEIPEDPDAEDLYLTSTFFKHFHLQYDGTNRRVGLGTSKVDDKQYQRASGGGFFLFAWIAAIFRSKEF